MVTEMVKPWSGAISVCDNTHNQLDGQDEARMGKMRKCSDGRHALVAANPRGLSQRHYPADK